MISVGENFVEDNKEFLSHLNKLGSEDIEVIWNIVNRFLFLNKLGISQIEIDIKNKILNIYHYNSPFVRYLEDYTNKKVCYFFEVLYSYILSTIFEDKINVKEVECKNESKRDFCIFAMA
ncbi:MAG: hypothetical protein ABWJ98_03035 [Hydrogenothermaceae bacterium]